MTIKLIAFLLGLFILANISMAGGKLSVFFIQNGVERKLAWQCEELNECIEIFQNRIEEKGGCDPKVVKVVLERIHIPGIDDV